MNNNLEFDYIKDQIEELEKRREESYDYEEYKYFNTLLNQLKEKCNYKFLYCKSKYKQ